MAELKAVQPDAILSIKLAEISASIGELERLCEKKIDASEAFSNACKLTALKASIDASVLARFVAARVNDTLKKDRHKVEQLSFLFDNF